VDGKRLDIRFGQALARIALLRQIFEAIVELDLTVPAIVAAVALEALDGAAFVRGGP